MKRALIFSAFLICFFLSIEAQKTGQFSISLDGKKINIEGDTSKSYNSLILKFDQQLKGHKINFFDSPYYARPSFNNDQKLGSSIGDGSKGNEIIINVIPENNKYLIDGFKGNELPLDFTVKIDDTYSPTFHLINLNSTAKEKKSVYKPGYLLYDAIYINNNWSKKDVDTTKLILSYYQIDANNIKDNNFLNDALTNLYDTPNKHNSQEQGGGDSEKLTPATLLNTIGGLDVTNIADGFAKFIVKRTKQELSIAFFDKFKSELDSFPDLQTLFPQTYRTLSAIGDEIYMFQAYIQTLRESFEKDLASLPSNLPGIIDNHSEYFDKVPELEAELRTAFYMADAIQNKVHPGEIIEDYPVDILDSVKNHNIKAVFKTLQLFSMSLKSNNDSTYWASYSDIKELAKDTTLLKIYLGLILQKARNVNIKFNDKDGNPFFLADEMNKYYKMNTDLRPYKTYLLNFATKTQSLETKIKALKKTTSDSLLFENYYSVISSSIDLMKYAVQIDKLPLLAKDSINIAEITRPYFDMTQTSANIAIDVNRRNYASAIVNATHLYDLVISKWNISEKEIKEAREKIEKIISKNTVDFITTYGYLPNTVTLKFSNRQIDELQPYINKIHYSKIYKEFHFQKDAINKILRYGSFMALITQAKTSDEVEAAIEAVALPTGSTRIKRETSFNVALNAYCGLYAGKEQIKGIDEKGLTGFPNTFGVSAPIGISISKGRSCGLPILGAFGEGHFSHSLLFSIVDIGALTAFRFTDTSTQSVPNIQLKDIISPGIFYSWGILKSPVSINIGWQMGPLLREVTATHNNYSQSYSRWSISICIDLPLLNLYTKPKD